MAELLTRLAGGTEIHPVTSGTWLMGINGPHFEETRQIRRMPVRDLEDIPAIAATILAGQNHIDTAELYESEDLVGRAWTELANKELIDPRKLLVASKIWYWNMHEGEVTPTIDAMRWRLGMRDHDLKAPRPELLMYLHTTRHGADWETALPQLAQAQRDGKIDHVGLSEWFTVEDIQEAQRLLGDVAVRALQLEYSVNNQGVMHDEIRAYCREHNIRLVGSRALSEGKILSNPHVVEVMRTRNQQATSPDQRVSRAQIALRFLIDQDIWPVVKSSSLQRIADNAAAAHIAPLTPDELAFLRSYRPPKDADA